MKKLVLLLFALSIFGMQAQETDPNKRLTEITADISNFVKQEKADLKTKLLEVEKRLKAKEITNEEAESLKQKYTQNSSSRIAEYTETKTAKIGEIVEEIVNEGTKVIVINDDTEDEENDDDKKDVILKINIPKDKITKKKKDKKPKRTVDRFVFAVGMNNVIANGDFSTLESSDYKMWQSNTVEFGWAWKTRVIEKSSLLNLKYGFGFRWNVYSPKGNLFHVDSGDNTDLVTHVESLDKSKLSSTYLVTPVYLEFDFSKPKITDGKTKLRRNKSVRLGLGGYAGLRLWNTNQTIEYSNDIGDIETKIKSDYNLGRFKYGIATYLGYEDVSVFVNYDLNPLFENQDLNNVSLGLRWDW